MHVHKNRPAFVIDFFNLFLVISNIALQWQPPPPKNDPISKRLREIVTKEKEEYCSGREVGGWGRDPKKCTGRGWGMGSSTINEPYAPLLRTIYDGA